MSIWSPHGHVGWDRDYRRYRGGRVRSYMTGWSNRHPHPDDGRPATVEFASIPAWCVPGHGDEHDDDETVGAWVRLSVDGWVHDFHHPRRRPTDRKHVDVVMDEDAVRLLRDELTAWLEQPKVRPR